MEGFQKIAVRLSLQENLVWCSLVLRELEEGVMHTRQSDYQLLLRDPRCHAQKYLVSGM